MRKLSKLFNSSPRNYSIATSSFLIAIALVLVSGNLSASQSSGTSVTTCYDKKTGDLRYLIKGKCKSTEKTLSIGKPGAQGPRGATGPRGAAGAPGLSQGLSASGMYSDSGTYTPTTELSGAIYKWVFNTGEPTVYGASTAENLSLTGTSDVQVTANLMFRAVNSDQADLASGRIICSMFRGAPGANLSSYTYLVGSTSILDVSPTSSGATFTGTMTLIGWSDMSGENVFAGKCISSGTPGDIRLVEYTVNAIAIG